MSISSGKISPGRAAVIKEFFGAQLVNIIPAIDLQNGQCVRLYKGDYAQRTVYSEDALRLAESFYEQGAEFLHIVDLDGAKSPKHSNTALIEEIARKTRLKIQCGGGLRKQEQVERLFNSGIAQVIIGSLAIQEPQTVQLWLQKFGPARLILALDVKFIGGIPHPTTAAWQKTSSASLWELLASYENLEYLLCTDISRDGTLSSPNTDLYIEIMQRYPQVKLLASGGVASLADLTKLRAAKLYASIVGKALYEKRFTLAQALGLMDES